MAKLMLTHGAYDVLQSATLPEMCADILPADAQDNGDSGKEGKIAIRLQLTQLSPDPQNFKPYSPQFKPPENQPIQVQVEILKRYVKEIKSDGTIILSAMGLAKIAQLICTGIAKIHVEEE
jgi:hypothetical protein